MGRVSVRVRVRVRVRARARARVRLRVSSHGRCAPCAAQAAGIAEADPDGDLSGMDAAVKVVALVNSLGMGDPIRLSDVAVEARRRLEPRMVLHAGCTHGACAQRPCEVCSIALQKHTWYALACRACAASLQSARLRRRRRGARCGW